MPKKKKKRRSKRRAGKKGKPTLAQRADRHDLYQRSVQEPECEVAFFERAYRDARGRAPRSLREDFCGTFAVSCEWVRKRGRTAIGVDLDPEPLAWGREHNLSRLSPAEQKRVTIIQGDVREIGETKVDVLAAENFSYWVFKTRDELRAYFEIARQNLAEDGVMVLDLMGGSECYIEDDPDVRKLKGFRYEWELTSFDPLSHDLRQTISFAFKDGSRLDEAFVYEWRFWSIPEVRELLAEAGFSKTTVYWEGEDEDGEGNDEWEPIERGTCDPSWIAYVVAER
jgi:hypothetical protein